MSLADTDQVGIPDPLALPSAGQRVRLAVLVAPPTALQIKAPRPPSPQTGEAFADGEEREDELDVELATTIVDVTRL
jgi:hypothetical protein